MGCAAFLPKPPDPSVLYPTLQNILEATPRQNIRLAASLKVVIGDGMPEGGEVRTEYTSVISEGGLYVMTINPRSRGSQVPLCLHIREREMRAQGLVLYVNVLSEGSFDAPGMGIRFVDLAGNDRDFIRRFIVEELTKDIRQS
jgi:Tfp pilus assembly protein PilZ